MQPVTLESAASRVRYPSPSPRGIIGVVGDHHGRGGSYPQSPTRSPSESSPPFTAFGIGPGGRVTHHEQPSETSPEHDWTMTALTPSPVFSHEFRSPPPSPSDGLDSGSQLLEFTQDLFQRSPSPELLLQSQPIIPEEEAARLDAATAQEDAAAAVQGAATDAAEWVCVCLAVCLLSCLSVGGCLSVRLSVCSAVCPLGCLFVRSLLSPPHA